MAPDGVDIGGESVLHVSSCVVSDCLKDMEQMALMTGHSADAELLRKGYPYRKVAKLTNVSESTVKRLKKRVLYISGLYEKNVVILHRSKTETILETVI